MGEQPIHSLTMLRRRCVCVREWFDEGQELPWSYVARIGNGQFEAVTSYLVDDLHEARERLLGVFDTKEAATTALDEHLHRLHKREAADFRALALDYSALMAMIARHDE